MGRDHNKTTPASWRPMAGVITIVVFFASLLTVIFATIHQADTVLTVSGVALTIATVFGLCLLPETGEENQRRLPS